MWALEGVEGYLKPKSLGNYNQDNASVSQKCLHGYGEWKAGFGAPVDDWECILNCTCMAQQNAGFHTS